MLTQIVEGGVKSIAESSSRKKRELSNGGLFKLGKIYEDQVYPRLNNFDLLMPWQLSLLTSSTHVQSKSLLTARSSRKSGA